MSATALHAQPLTDQRAQFEVDDAVAYFNTAAMSPFLRSVVAAGERALALRAHPWRIELRHWFEPVEEVRDCLARLLDTPAANVALVPSTSYGLAAVARNLDAGPGDRVLVLAQEFPSNHYTWERFARSKGADLLVVGRENGQTWTEAVLAAIDERVAVASIPNVHWTNGSLVDLEKVAPALRQAGSRFVIDASQSLGAMPLDLASLRPDALVAVGYKWLLGPYSLGYLYVDPSLHDGVPLEENWIARAGSDDFSGIADYGDEYRPGAQRFDVGERSNFQLNPMAAAALQQVREWTVERIAATLRTRTDQIAAGAERLGLEVQPAPARGPHMLGLALPRQAARRVAAALEESRVVVSVRGSSLRISPHLHNNQADIDRLLDAVASSV
jgi:selenocysteine lyase/cysteine desulfurase